MKRPLNLLLVDDREDDAMNVRRAFRASGVSDPLYVAASADEALRMLRDGTVPRRRRLVLLDLEMPGMNGMEFLRAFREERDLACTPVVVLTTSNDERDRTEAYNLNVAGYVLKPVSPHDFRDAMAALIQYWSLVELP